MQQVIEAIVNSHTLAAPITATEHSPIPVSAPLSWIKSVDALPGITVREYSSTPGRPFRYESSVLLSGGDGKTAEEILYLAVQASYGGVVAIDILKIADIVWTSSDVAVPADVGGDGAFRYPSSVAVSSTGLVESRNGGVAIGTHTSTPALVSIYDPGVAVYIISSLILAGEEPATGAVHRSMRWR